MSQQNLVSVVVISYNAEKYIIETLESIKDQTYENIELIISDDASSDRTIELAEEWKRKNETRFAEIIIRVSDVNQGLAGNCNLGFRLCKGKYTKLIASDDKLTPDCLESLVGACEEKKYQVITGKMQSFGSDGVIADVLCNKEFFQKSATEQYVELLETNYAAAPTGLYETAFLKQVGYFDEQYPFMEDYPFWLKITKMGYKINLCDKVVVHYRRNEDSITSTTNEKVVGKNYFKTYKKFFYQKKLVPLIKCKKVRVILREIKEFIYKDLILLFGNKRNSKTTKVLHKLFYS